MNRTEELLSDQVQDLFDKKIYYQVQELNNPADDQIFRQICDQVDIRVYDQIWNQVYNQLYNQISDQVWSLIRAQVKDNLINPYG